VRVFCFFACLSKSQQHDRHPYFLDTLNEEKFHSFVDALAPKQKSAYKRSKRYKDKVGAYQALREFEEEVEASKARGQTSWGLDSFSSRPVPKEVDEQDGQDEEPDERADDQGQDDEEEHESDEGDGALVDAKDEKEVDAITDESDQSDSVEPRTASQVKVKARLGKREKQSIVNAGDAHRTAETKKLARASDVVLVVLARKNGLDDMVKLDAQVRKDLVSALVDVKLRKLEPTSVLREVELLVDDIVKSSIANLKAFQSAEAPQNVVRLKFDLKDIAKAATDEDFGRLYLEIAKVLDKAEDRNASQVFFVNQAEAALGMLFEQFMALNGEQKRSRSGGPLHAKFYSITVRKLGNPKTPRYFKNQVMGATGLAALYDTFHALHHAKRSVGTWIGNHAKLLAALTSAGEEYDAVRMKLLTAGGQAPNEADMRRLKEFEIKHSIDKKRQRK
jgi:hypothetical protein